MWHLAPTSILLALAACGFASHPQPDAGIDAAAPTCLDPDEDGWGEGAGCLGADCLEGDGLRHECVCDAEGVGVGCPCGDETTPKICYEGPDGTAGVGACEVGLRSCRDGRWTTCERQVLPSAEACNGVDEDCDGMPDDGVLSECDNCVACDVRRFGVDGEAFPLDGDDLVARDDGAVTLAGPGHAADLSILLVDDDECPAAWGPFEISAAVPEGARIAVYARGAWSAGELPAAPWNTVLLLPGDATRAPLFPDGNRQWAYVEIMLHLEAAGPDALPVVEWVTIGSHYQSCTFE